MEVVRGALHTPFAMDEPSCVGEARRHAATLAVHAGLDEVQAGRLALVVTELGNNLVRHAQGGRLLLSGDPAQGQVEVIAMDRGPGMPDVARSLRDGFSTGGTPGTGLGAVRRLASEFHLHSVVPEGTIIVARVRSAGSPMPRPHGIRVAGISIALAGELVCGDGWAAAVDGQRAALLVADGLGHGADAAQAAQAAIETFAAAPMTAPRAMMIQAHAVLRATRGAAVSVLHLDAAASSVRSCGAGNVVARLVSGDADKTLLTQHGTAGVQIRTPEEVQQPWPPHALLVAHTDGVESRWHPQRLRPVLGQDPTLAAALLLRDHSRGRDDATVVVARRND